MTEDLYRQGVLLVPTRGRGQYIREYSSWREKFPSLDAYMDVWREYPQAQPEVLCGSGDIVAIDVDEKNRPGIAAIFDEELRTSLPELYPLLYVERTASGGMHYFFKCPNVKSEDIAFAPQTQTLEEEFSGDPIKYRPIIEIKSAMRLCRVYPCEGIAKLQGDILALPVVSDGDFQHMRYIASLLNEREEEKKEIAKQKSSVTVSGDRPGDDYSANAETTEIVALLEKHGWTVLKGNAYRGRILLNRPGAKTRGVDADILNRVFCVWSSSVDGFTVGEGLSFFSLYARLEHRGDFVAAAKDLKAKGWAKPITVQNGVTPVRGEVVAVSEETGEPVTLWDEIQEEIRKSWDDTNTEYTVTFRHQEGLSSEVFGVAAPGMIILATGREKARKTAFIHGMLSANVSGQERVGFSFAGDGALALLDTEQSNKWIKVARERLMVMGGISKEQFLEKVIYVPLVGFPDHEKRMNALREVVLRTPNLTALVIDGDKDMVEDPNNLKECRAHISELRAMAKNRGFILIVVMHLNKGADRNVSGHLGSEWVKACDIRLDLVLDEETNHTTVSCPFIRGERLPAFCFKALRGNIPQIIGYPQPEYDYQGYFPPKAFEGQMPTEEPDRPFSLPSTTHSNRVALMSITSDDLFGMNQQEQSVAKVNLTDAEFEDLYARD